MALMRSAGFVVVRVVRPALPRGTGAVSGTSGTGYGSGQWSSARSLSASTRSPTAASATEAPSRVEIAPARIRQRPPCT